MHEACCEGGSVWEIWNIITLATPYTVISGLKGLNMEKNSLAVLTNKLWTINHPIYEKLEGLKKNQAEITEQFSVPILFPTSVCWDETKGKRAQNGQQIFLFRSVYIDTYEMIMVGQ